MVTRRLKTKASMESEQVVLEKTVGAVEEKQVTGVSALTITQLIDEGLVIDEWIKGKTKRLKLVKEELLSRAKEEKWKKAEGTIGMAVISGSTATVCSWRKLALKLKEMGKLDLSATLIGVKVGEVRKYLGDLVVEEITESESHEEYSAVSLKRKK